MIDKDLHHRLGSKTKELPEVDLRLRLPVNARSLAGEPHLVRTAGEAALMVANLQDLDVRYIGIDTEYRCGLAGRPDDDDEDDWQDLSQLHPISVGLAVVAGGRDSNKIVVVRYCIDVRQLEVLPGLEQVLRMPALFIAHYFKAEHFTVRALHLTWPKAFFCTWVAAALLDLGRHHWRYEDPDPVDETAEFQAELKSKNKRRSELSLLTLTQRHGVTYHFVGDKKKMQSRYMCLPDSEELTATDAEYVTADACASAELYLKLKVALAENGLDHHYTQVELPGALAMAEIEYDGVTVSPAKIALARESAERAVILYEEALARYGFGRKKLTRAEQAAGVRAAVKVTSCKERQRILGKLRLLHLFRSRKTVNGFSFSTENFERHRGEHRVIQVLAWHSHLTAVLRDRFFQGHFIGADGKVHPRINVLGADSGRPSFSKPNLVGIPRFMRPLVVPDDERHGIAEIDFSCQEVFITAVQYGDPVLLHDCNAGDCYWQMVRQFCGAELAPGDRDLGDDDLERKYPQLRKRWKILTLATIYGMGDKSIAAGAKITVEAAKRLRAQFFGRYSKLGEGIDLAVRQLRDRGYAQTATGVRRYRGTVGPLNPWEEHWAVNSPVQGGAACILKLMLPRLAAFLRQYNSRVLLPIFDAVAIHFPLDHLNVVLAGAERIMIEAMAELYPGTAPRVKVTAGDVTCWNKDDAADSIERYVASVEANLRDL